MYWGTSKVPQLPGISARGWAGLLGASSRIENIAASLLPRSVFPVTKVFAFDRVTVHQRLTDLDYMAHATNTPDAFSFNFVRVYSKSR